jgi:hypothetical protein
MDPREQVEKYKQEYAFLVQAAEQVKKDFGAFAPEIILPAEETNAYHALFDQLRPVVERLAEAHAEPFRAILYRVDIPEKDLAQVYAVQPLSAMYDVLTDLILHRELFKVVCRHLYR